MSVPLMSIFRKTVFFFFLRERWGRGKQGRKETDHFHWEICFFQSQCENSYLKFWISYTLWPSRHTGRNSTGLENLVELRQYVLWPKALTVAPFHLENRKPLLVLSEVSWNLPADSNENFIGSLGFGKMTVEVKGNYNWENLSKGNFEHFSC